MSRLLGVDIRASHIRVAVLFVSYRKLAIEHFEEFNRADVPTLEQALQACVAPHVARADSIGTAIEGDVSYLHRVRLPVTAQKQLQDVVPFEIEAQVPVDIDELVFDFKPLPRHDELDPDHFYVATAAARLDYVRSRIDLFRTATGREPDRVGCGPDPLCNLVSITPELAGPGPIALVDLGGARTEVALLSDGHAVFSRTLSRGIAGLPESAPALAAELRQTLVGWVAHGGPSVQSVYLLGRGAAAQGAEQYLAYELGVPVQRLMPPTLEGLTPDQLELYPRFAKAVALALAGGFRGQGLDLRQGPLEFQRGYGFLKEKVPLLAGLGAAIALSFFFSSWAESRALEREGAALEERLAVLSQEVLGIEVREPEEADSALTRARKSEEEDPMPHLDGFGLVVVVSEAVPMEVSPHDIEELELSRGKATLRGVVGATEQAQQVATNIEKHRCLEDAKIAKITQAVNSDKQKYQLEFTVQCPEDIEDKDKKKKSEAGG